MASIIERGPTRMQIYLEASHTAKTNARTGIQGVVRGLIRGLSSRGCEVHPVRWSFQNKCLTPLKPEWARNLGLPKERQSLWLPPSSLMRPKFWPLWARALGLNFKVPLHRHPVHAEIFRNRWLILPELMEGPHVRRISDYAKRCGMRVAGVFHDAIPWLHPEVVRHWSRQQHAEYMRSFSELDVVIAVSDESARHFIEFAELRSLPTPPVRVCGLAAEVADQARETELKEAKGDPVKILCVSTLEPRKNHDLVIKAFELACARLEQAGAELHLVGAADDGDPGIAEEVEAATKKNPAIFWHRELEPADLREHFQGCDFTVFGSEIEGFGLPVMESLWFGKPCLCSDKGVMAQNARDGGCLTVDVRDVNAIADGMVRLAGDPDFRERLAGETLRRKLKTWNDFAGETLEVLKGI